MGRVFEEGHLRFSFGESWRVEKYDEHRDYRQKIAKLEETRAVDFVGVQAARALFLIEVKDFRGSRIENKYRLAQGELALETAHKVRDTVAGLLAAWRSSSEPENWEPFVTALVQREKRLCVVLWIEEDRPAGHYMTQRGAVAHGTFTKLLKSKLRWLTTKVVIANRRQAGLPDLQVSSLERGS